MEFINNPAQSLFESIHCAEWTIKNFKVLFILSERVLAKIRKISCQPNWYEDPVAVATYIDRVSTCFVSIKQYHAAFGTLPQVGDRLYNGDTGMIIQERSIDGAVMTITFTISL